MRNKNSYSIKTAINITDYMSIVTDISDAFFDTDGDYQPHIGRMTAIMTFFNYCVKDSSYNGDIKNIPEMEKIMTDEELVKAFNDEISVTPYFELRFGSAYRDAMDIVFTKKDSLSLELGKAFSALKNSLPKAIKDLSSALSNENIADLSKILESLSDGETSIDDIVESVKDTIEKSNNSKTE